MVDKGNPRLSCSSKSSVLSIGLLCVSVLVSGSRLEMESDDSLDLQSGGDLMLDFPDVEDSESELPGNGLLELEVSASGEVDYVTPPVTPCIDNLVSRRRRVGEMCSCRRRSGRKGLQAGWRCQGHQIIHEEAAVRNAACCCKAGPCTMEAIRRGGVVETTEHQGSLTVTKCCKMKEQGLFGSVTHRCPAWTGYSEHVEDHTCDVSLVVSSVDACTEKVVAWFRNVNWYKALFDWERYETEYSSYFVCDVEREHHIERVMSSQDWNGILSLAQPNAVRRSIESRGQCDGLSQADFLQVAARSHAELCTWYLPHTWYRPKLQPEGTCSFDDDSKRINLHPGMLCPEGHRCACPIYSELDTAIGNSNFYSLPSMIVRYGVMGIQYGAVYGPILGVTALSSLGGVFTSPLIAAVSPVVGVVAFGAAYVYQTMQFSCQRNVGCFPMDCVKIERGEDQGCRIRPVEELQDERNPFWFMPPPNFKCSFNYGSCSLQACSARNKIAQTVGLQQSSGRLSRFRNGLIGISTIHNCQPLLYEDMTSVQKSRFETDTHTLELETSAYLENRHELARQVERQCPWKRPTVQNYGMECRDGTSCTARFTKSCCDAHLGVAKCPRRHPYMCVNGDCDSIDGNCKGKGGLKPCPAERLCPWLVPLVEPEDQSTLVSCGRGPNKRNALHCIDYADMTQRTQQVGGPFAIASCSDECGWRDSQNFSCEIYASSNRWCTKYGRDYSVRGHTAGTACCACGNRSWIGRNTGSGLSLRGYSLERGYVLEGTVPNTNPDIFFELSIAVQMCDEHGRDCAGFTCQSRDECSLHSHGNVVCAGSGAEDVFSYVKDGLSGDCCREERQMKRCPMAAPVMCNDRTCGDDYCCARSAEECTQRFGGPRICEFSHFDDVTTGDSEDKPEYNWAVGNRVLDTTARPTPLCGTIISAAAGSADPVPFRIQYDDGFLSKWLSESQLGRSVTCAMADDGSDETEEPVVEEEEEPDEEEPDPAQSENWWR